MNPAGATQRIMARVLDLFNQFSDMIAERPRLPCRREAIGHPKVKQLEDLTIDALASAKELLRTNPTTLHQLPNVLLHRMMVSKSTESLRFLARDLGMFLTPDSRELCLCLQPLERNSQVENYRRNLREILDLVENTCMESLESVSIIRNICSTEEVDLMGIPRNQPSPPRMFLIDPTCRRHDVSKQMRLEQDKDSLVRQFVLDLLSLLSDLREISFRYVYTDVMTDDTMKVIAERHPNIKCLRMDECSSKVTTEGMKTITQTCKQLETLCMRKSTRGQRFTSQDIAHIVQELPQLKEVDFDNVRVGLIYYALETPSPAPRNIKFTLYSHDMDHKPPHIPYPQAVGQILNTFPAVDGLLITDFPLSEELVSILEGVSNELKEIKFQDFIYNLPLQKRLCERFKNLTKLSVLTVFHRYPKSTVHLGLVGCCCPNIEVVSIDGIIVSGDDYPTETTHFTKLMYLSLFQRGSSQFSDMLIGQLYGGVRLRSVLCLGIDVRDNVLMEACERNRSFPELESFTLQCGGPTSIGGDVTTLITLACKAPLLQAFTVGGASITAESHLVAKFFFQNYFPDIGFYMVQNDPE